MSLLYLDFNRTTPLAPSVQEAMEPYWSKHFMLPDQAHSQSQAIQEALEHAREGIAALLGCEPFEVVFTHGGTEANNLAIQGLTRTKADGHILVSELEHDSVSMACEALGRNWIVERYPCRMDGCVAPEDVASRLRQDTKLVCLQAANPILGTIQPVREVADLCHNRGVLLHCDATQIFGKTPAGLEALRADTIAISGHKFYGPKGTGALYIRRGLEVAPIAFGEPREMGLGAGSENVPGSIGLGAAAHLGSKCSTSVFDNLGELRDMLANGIVGNLGDSAKVLCEDSPRLPNTLAIELPLPATTILTRCRRIVCANAQSESPPDAVTRALRCAGQCESEIAKTISFSVGWTTSRDEINSVVNLICEACEG